jgi:hypothetical protein
MDWTFEELCIAIRVVAKENNNLFAPHRYPLVASLLGRKTTGIRAKIENLRARLQSKDHQGLRNGSVLDEVALFFWYHNRKAFERKADQFIRERTK